MKSSPTYGIIIDPEFIEESHISMLENLLKFDNANLTVIFFLDAQKINHKQKNFIANSFISKSKKYLKSMSAKNSLEDLLNRKEIQKLNIDPKILNNSTITINFDQIRLTSEIQFILNFSKFFIEGDILDLPQFGVWSFYHEDNAKLTKIPICYNEMKNAISHFDCYLNRINRKNETLIIRHSRIKLFSHSYKKNIKNINDECFSLIKLAIHDIISDSLVFNKCTLPDIGCHNNGSFKQSSSFKITLLKKYIFFMFDLIFYNDLWAIVIITRPISSFLENNTLNEYQYLLKNENFAFYADPFGMHDENKYVMACERFNYFNNRGEINLFEINNELTKCEKIKTINFCDCHQSYPFLLKKCDAYYCLPEIADSNRIIMYKAKNLLFENTEEHLILEDFEGLDPTIMFFNDRYWIFCSNKKFPLSNALYIFHSSSIDGPWIPHNRNPVKMDICSSRPGGTPFIHENILYRPAQDCSETYGGRIVINRIHELSPTEFKEEIVSVIEPERNHEYSNGIHTISAMGEYTLIDMKKRIFSIQLFLLRLKNIVNRNLIKTKPRIDMTCYDRN